MDNNGDEFISTDLYDFSSTSIGLPVDQEKYITDWRHRAVISPELWEQVLCMVSITGMCLLVFLVLLPSMISSDCITKFKAMQMSNVAGRTLFSFFILTLCLNLSSCLVFTYGVLHEEGSNPLFRRQYMPCSFLLYSLGKWSMSTFFVFRLYFFILKNTGSQRVARQKLIILMLMLTAAVAISGYCYIRWWMGDIKGPDSLTNCSYIIRLNLIRYGINLTMDIILTLCYFRGLIAVIKAQVKVEVASPSEPTSTGSDEFSDQECEVLSIEGEIGRRTEIIHPVPNESNEWTESSNDSNSFPNQSLSGSTKFSSDSSGKFKVTLNSKLINIVTKSTLLNLIGVTSSCTLVGSHGYILVSGDLDPFRGGALRNIDGLINVFCIFLVFGFASPYYYCLCRCCHLRMRRCSTSVAKRMAVQTKDIRRMTIHSIQTATI